MVSWKGHHHALAEDHPPDDSASPCPTAKRLVRTIDWSSDDRLTMASLPARLAVAALLLLLFACTSGDPVREREAAPEHDELTAAIAEFGEPFYEFDQLRAVLVADDEDVLFEQYYETGEDAYWGMQSVTKSVVSTLVGIALGEGLIGSLDDTLGDMLPRYADVMSPRTAGITLRQLLTMSAGLPSGDDVTGPEFLRSEDWVRHIVTHPELPPGQRFLYSNATSHLLSAILSEKTGEPALHYARARLFDPLGIDTTPALVRVDGMSRERAMEEYDEAGFAWPADPQGVSTGWWGLRLRPRDMVRFGQLFLAEGVWDGERLVPADWVEEATREQVAATDGLLDGYGFQWWTTQTDGEHSFQAIGYGGQHIVVLPSRRLVVVTATEVRQADPSSHGIDNQVLTGMIEHLVASRFPPPS